MDRFKNGGVVFHKATLARCVIIKINDDDTVLVRDEKNNKIEYYPQELLTEEEVEERDKNIFGVTNSEEVWG